METLEPRQMLAANLASTGGVHPDAIIDPNDNITPANIGTVVAASFAESETVGTVGQNDGFASAEFIPLGTRTADEPLADISGTLSLFNTSTQNQASEDVDFYAVDLRAGDILDLAGDGAAGSIDVFYQDGSRWFAIDSNTVDPLLYPANSPLQTLGNVAGSQVVPESGRYFIRVGTNGLAGSYTIGARTYRPVLESEPIGTQQTLFIDFDGFTTSRSTIDPIDPETGLPNTGTIRIDAMADFLFDFNLLDRDEDELIDAILSRVEEDFLDFLPQLSGNGDYANTGTPGEYGIQILNSRDHADPIGQEHVTRVVVGGVSTDIFSDDPLLGISQSIDIGNFDTSEIVFAVLDQVLPYTAGIPFSGAVSQLDLIAQTIAVTVSHEAAHSFGLLHTDGTNRVGSLVDGPGPPVQAFDFELGPDGVFGTEDDEPLLFPFEDRFDRNEGYFGFQRVADSLAHVLSTGTVGQTVSGRVFRDLNADGRGTGDPGLAGITVFADLNNNGVHDGSEPNTVTTSDGSYQLQLSSGSTNITVLAPTNSTATTPTRQTVSAPASGVNFGFSEIQQETGVVFVDLNGNGARDANEPGIPDAHLFLDLNNDGRVDIGEPRAVSGPDGSYTIGFPGPGTFTLRQIPDPDFVVTSPASGSHTVEFDGSGLDRNFNFANRAATRDFDVRIVTPLSPGQQAVLEVEIQNEGGTAFFSGWVDFNQDGAFGAGEQVIVDRPVGRTDGSQTLLIPFTVPAVATPGDVTARFRFNREPGLGPNAPAGLGKVQDVTFTVRPTADLVADDEFTVSRNTVGNALDVLNNDFQTETNPLTVRQLNTAGTRGSVQIAGDGKSVLYTPPNGFVGRDVFRYIASPAVDDGSLTQEDLTATVVVNVSFQSDVPIAVDDTFHIPKSSFNRPLNVLDNDIPSLSGGSTIVSVGGATANGTVQIAGGGQSLLYTPAIGFAGTEQFSYSILDNAGGSSTAQVTVNLLPDSQQDDQVAFIIDTFDVDDNRPLPNVRVGDEFLLRVSVDDLRNAPEGVTSAFLDLLYSEDAVSLVPQTGGTFPFEITFGPSFGGFQRGDADTPGLLNEIGGFGAPAPGTDLRNPARLFTVRMQAVAPGFATFQADPADDDVSEVLLLGQNTAVPVSGLRLGSHELRIDPRPGDGRFTTAVDDSFPDGIDSEGNAITVGGTAVLDVLANDVITSGAELQDFGVSIQPKFGTGGFNESGEFVYQANAGQQGVERFNYFIVDSNGIRSTAQVSFNVGDAASDDTAAIEFQTVDEAGNPIGTVRAGDRFGVQVILNDLRSPTAELGIFAAYLDVLYDAGLVTPSDRLASDFGFDVAFADGFNRELAVGSATTPGVINEFGTLRSTPTGELDAPGGDPQRMATIFFEARADAAGQTARFVGDKADFSPFQDTLFFDPPGPVDPDQIRYDIASITITSGAGEGESLLQNSTNPLDVNNDGVISPIDALGVINALNQSVKVGEGETAGTVTRFPDVDGDGNVTPSDALKVINALNKLASSRGAEGEGTAVPLIPLDPPRLRAASEDAVDADLESNTPNVSDSTLSDSQVAKQMTDRAVPDANADDDDEEEDILALLADDVHNVWK